MSAAVTARESRIADSSIARFTEPIWRSKLLVVLMVAYGAFLGALLPTIRPVGYTATAEVLLKPVIADPTTNQRNDQLVSLDTEAVVMGSDQVLSKASEITGLTVPDLRKNLTVVAVPSSLVLRVSESQERPRDARLAADAVVVTYLQQREARARKLVDDETASIAGQVAGVEARLNDLSAKTTAAAPASAERAALQSLQSSTAQQLAALQTRQFALQRTQIDSGQVLRNASKTTAAGFGRSSTIPAGAVMGLLAGCVLAVLLDRLSRTIRRSSDVLRATGSRVIASVRDGRLDPTLTTDEPEEEDAPAYRRALLAIEPGEDAIVAIVASGRAADAAPISSGLATVAARGGSDVALLLLEPGAGDDEGAVEVVALGRVLGELDAARPPALRVGRGQLTVYLGDPSLQELATPLALANACAHLRSMHDLIVVEVEDPLGSALADGWIRAADRTVVAATLRRTRTGQLRRIVAHLDDTGHPPVGTILLG
jgi:capsular polysaccharide biosynthesis protein